MKTAVAAAIISCAAACAAALAPRPASAQSAPERQEITLDIDRNGTADRAVLTGNPGSGLSDLAIYLDAGDGAIDPSRKPAILKRGIADARILAFESKGKGSLVVTYGCGGCSNDTEIALTVVHRNGAFLIGGYTYSWDTRNGSGTCDINFLTGKGTMARDLGKARPIGGRFAPVKLADWSEEKRPRACVN
jgi:hypothetical protein